MNGTAFHKQVLCMCICPFLSQTSVEFEDKGCNWLCTWKQYFNIDHKEVTDYCAITFDLCIVSMPLIRLIIWSIYALKNLYLAHEAISVYKQRVKVVNFYLQCFSGLPWSRKPFHLWNNWLDVNLHGIFGPQSNASTGNKFTEVHPTFVHAPTL